MWTWARVQAANVVFVVLTCLVLTVECAIAKSIARPVSFDDTPTSWTAKLARNTLTTFFLTGTIALKTIQARATFILAVRTVTCQIVDFALVDHTGRVRTGAKILLRALEAVLAASTNTCRIKGWTGAVITSVLVFVAAVRTIAVIIIHIVLADKTAIVADKRSRWCWCRTFGIFWRRLTACGALAKSTRFRVAGQACLVITVRTVTSCIAHESSLDETPTTRTAKLAFWHLRNSLTTECWTVTL